MGTNNLEGIHALLSQKRKTFLTILQQATSFATLAKDIMDKVNPHQGAGTPGKRCQSKSVQVIKR